MYRVLFAMDDDPDDEIPPLHQTQCPLGTPLPRRGDTIALPNGGLYDVNAVVFEYAVDSPSPSIIIRVDDF